MRKCPNCGADALLDRLMCANCHKLIYGTEVPQIETRKQTPKRSSKKPRSSPEYVKLYHGGYVKKSTYNWLKKKDADINNAIWIWLGIGLLFALLSECS